MNSTETVTVVDQGVILVPKNKNDLKFLLDLDVSERSSHLQYPGGSSSIYNDTIQHNLRNELPVVIAGYILPLDKNNNTMMQYSGLLSIGKAFGGKGPEAALVQCLADAYASIGTRTLKMILTMDQYNIDPHEIIRITNIKSELFTPIHSKELSQRLKVITGRHTQGDAIAIIQHLATKSEMKPLLIKRLGLNNETTRQNIIKVLGRSDVSGLNKYQQTEKMYNELLLFTPEDYRTAAVREFGEETGYAELDPDKLTHYYTMSEIKRTNSGNNYLKHRHYYFYRDSIGKQGDTRFSPSEADQQLININSISLSEANSKQIDGIRSKVEAGNLRKITTAVANCIAYYGLLKMVDNGTIKQENSL